MRFLYYSRALLYSRYSGQGGRRDITSSERRPRQAAVFGTATPAVSGKPDAVALRGPGQELHLLRRPSRNTTQKQSCRRDRAGCYWPHHVDNIHTHIYIHTYIHAYIINTTLLPHA